ncbi:MAG: two-component regulator propeller domain-containing protein, partial [Bacteroidota bacterium]
VGCRQGISIFNQPSFAKSTHLHLDLRDGIQRQDINLFNCRYWNEELLLVESSMGILRGQLLGDTSIVISKFFDATGQQVAPHFIYQALIDHEKNIWTATWQNRFKKYRIVDNQLEEVGVILNNGYQGMGNHAISIGQDEQHNIWIANTNGLYKLHRDFGQIITFPPSHEESCFTEGFDVKCLVADQKGYLWISATNGIYRLTEEDLLARKCPTDFFSIGHKTLPPSHNLYIDSQQRLWASSREGISISQLNSDGLPGPFSHFSAQDGLPHDWHYDVQELSPDSFLVGNYAGLILFTFPEGDFSTPSFKFYESNSERDNALANGWTIDMEMDEHNRAWVGTYSGISKTISIKEEGLFTNYLSNFGDTTRLSNNSIKKIFRDSKNRMWIATQTGLNLYRPTTDDFQQFSRADGLPSEYILGIAETPVGHLWIATTKGIVKATYQEKEQQLVIEQHFTTADGLTDNITNVRAFITTPKGTILAGSSKGISILNENAGDLTSYPFQLAITELAATQGGQPGFHPIRNRLNEGRLTLAHQENSLQIRYAS